MRTFFSIFVPVLLINPAMSAEYDDWKAPPPMKAVRLIDGKPYVYIRENPKSGPVAFDPKTLERHMVRSGETLPLVKVIEMYNEEYELKRGADQ